MYFSLLNSGVQLMITVDKKQLKSRMKYDLSEPMDKLQGVQLLAVYP